MSITALWLADLELRLLVGYADDAGATVDLGDGRPPSFAPLTSLPPFA
jgi:hypothetical protein